MDFAFYGSCDFYHPGFLPETPFQAIFRQFHFFSLKQYSSQNSSQTKLLPYKFIKKPDMP